MNLLEILSFPATWVITVASTLYLLYWYGTSTFNYFKDQGIPGPKPIPFVGNMWGIWKVNIPKYDRAMVKKYGRTLGYFDGMRPNLWTTDLELIKSIFVKDFDHFINRREFDVTQKTFRKMITIMKDQEWKDVRSSVTPAFTTGKIKRMSVMIKHCSDVLADKFEKIAISEGKIETKSQYSAFTMGVIARCAFGMTIDRLGEKGDPFIERAKKVFSPPANKSPLILLPFVFPKLLKFFGERIFFTEDFQFFIRVLENLVQERAKAKEKYHDFIEVATEAIGEFTKDVDGVKKAMWEKEEVDEIVIAQAVIFLLAGFDTTATTLTNTTFLLARNPDIQERLYQEVKERLEVHGEINHDMVLNFPYVDNVIHEALRMYPPAPRVERACNRDSVYNGIHIKKGTIVTVPAFSLHYDEEYYPEPETFNPDRWDADSPIKPNPNAFMPFGMGPRNCIGMRFAMEEMKIALCTILSRFRFFPVAETPERVEFEDGFLGVTQPIQATLGIEVRS